METTVFAKHQIQIMDIHKTKELDVCLKDRHIRLSYTGVDCDTLVHAIIAYGCGISGFKEADISFVCQTILLLCRKEAYLTQLDKKSDNPSLQQELKRRFIVDAGCLGVSSKDAEIYFSRSVTWK